MLGVFACGAQPATTAAAPTAAPATTASAAAATSGTPTQSTPSTDGTPSADGSSSNGPAPSVGDSGQLAPQRYLLESATGFSLVSGSVLEVSVSGQELSFMAGCNRHSTHYSLCGSRLCVAHFAATKRGCPGPQSGQDRWLSDFFRSQPEVRQDAQRLTLQGTAATLTFLTRELADPDRPLTGRIWTVQSFLQGDVQSTRNVRRPQTLQFESDGRVRLFTSCNEGSAQFVLNGANVTLRQVAYTKKACEAGAEAQDETEAEQLFMALLSSGSLNLDIDAAELTLRRGDVGLTAVTD